MNKAQQDFTKWAEQDWWGWAIKAALEGDTERYPDIIQAWEAYQAAHNAQQAIIDKLMLEFCPGEMTQEQVDEWAKHQKQAPEEYQDV